MKDEFIRFMKHYRCFDEFNDEIFPYTMSNLDEQFRDGGAEFVLNDGCIFYWKDAVTEVNWDDMNSKWVHYVENGGK